MKKGYSTPNGSAKKPAKTSGSFKAVKGAPVCIGIDKKLSSK